MNDNFRHLIERYFRNWCALTSVSLADLPRFGDAAVVYAIRVKGGEVLKIGTTANLRNRLFRNYMGGVGGPTMQWIHGLLFAEGRVGDVEFAWLETAKPEVIERQVTAAYRANHGRLPKWMKR